MKLVHVATELGRLELALERRELLEAARALALEHGQSGAKLAQPIRFAGRDAWLKASPLRGRARWRHGASRLFLRAPAPRVREALNLAWLEERLFQVPHPLAAGCLGGALPRWQFLVVESVAGLPLDVVLRGAEPEQRIELLFELARETARMHALHFVHRDLYWRNVLVRDSWAQRRLVFIDAWRGGERLQLRTPAHDLACLFLEGPSLLSASEIAFWLSAYAAERAAQGKPIGGSTWRRASADRRSLLARAQREPGRWRVAEAAVQEFDFAVAARSASKPALP